LLIRIGDFCGVFPCFFFFLLLWYGCRSPHIY
jgi:hypothetical protein